ncbi:kinase domain protein [Dictyocaulus viviparus]|uniref:Kinase domain protein n=1 Tax=Dictyocaulus viviparus TaxID=29172 RepID=A0A0D8X957_DICVI|nr:kinase domain protein [Dictyocaulus viviparus]
MSGLLRGALNLIQGESTSSSSHPLIGTQVEVGSIHLRVDSVIAEGGFAVVFAAYDSSNRWFALKRQIAKDNESVEAVVREIRIFKQLSGHQSILGFIAAAQMKIPSGGIEFMLLTELCSGGTVADRMKNTNFSIEQALKIFHSAAMAVCHMHDRVVPITHRDVKIENLLFSGKGHVKLCDFGSATTQIVCLMKHGMQRHTTPMYRAPEILDTYQNFVVGPQQDIWALGCVLFYLCYHVHPFEDSAKLRILNVAYSIPSGFEEFCDILPLIGNLLLNIVLFK